ncbi:Glycerophosphodiester phosphodiesterase GDPD5 [Vitis vinifera]|uniref:glycerophosphodiester phosphodiesterase n=1 Tax=Vitis vinifera TaxID=29760 RepID=A0A438IWI8_VITVI|nr:Glycerophosphodiester phosphodiesterase GDPD5 [Vitis vinifera]
MSAAISLSMSPREVVLLSTHGYHTHTSLYHLEQPEDFLVEKTTCCRSRDNDLQWRVHPLTCLHKAFEGHLNLVKGKTGNPYDPIMCKHNVHERICALSGVEIILSCGSLHSSSSPPMVSWYCSIGTTLRALRDCSLGTTLRALRYYLSGLETIQSCGSLHSSSAPPMVSWDYNLGTTLRALSLGTTLRALRYYLSGLETIQLCGSLHSSSAPPMVSWDCSLGTILRALSLGTTLRALRYYLSGLETIQLCGSLHSSSAPPMISWDCSLGTTLRALRYYLSGLELGTTLRALRYYLSGLECSTNGFLDCSLGTTLRALSLGTTLRALRYYLSGLETIQLCGSLHSSSAPPMISWECSLGTTLRALRYYLSGLELGTTLRALRYYLSGLEVHPYTYRNENQFLHFNFHQDPYAEYDYWINKIGVDGLFTYFTGSLHDFQEWSSSLSQDDGDDDGNAAKLLHKIATLVSPYKKG